MIQTGSYYRIKIEHSLKDLLIKNPWLFNDSYNFFTFYNDVEKIKRTPVKIEEAWISDDTVLCSGKGIKDKLKWFIDEIYWEDFGTWYINFYPCGLSDVTPKVIIDASNPLILGKVQNQKNDGCLYTENWLFIHEIKADIFITQQSSCLVIGSLNKENLEKLNLEF